MDKIAEIYTKQIHEDFKPLYANWQPDIPVKLGDYGELRNNIFIRMGNIKSDGITFSTRTNSGDATKSYSSKHGVVCKLSGRTEVQDVRARIEVSFASEEGVFFNIAGCNYTSIENKMEVGDKILLLNRQKKWLFNHVIVTDMVTAKNALILVSGGKQSIIKLEADASMPEIDLASLTLKLGVINEEQIGYMHKDPKNIAPLLGFSRLFSRFFGTDEFRPERMLPEDDNSNNDLYFDELRQ